MSRCIWCNGSGLLRNVATLEKWPCPHCQPIAPRFLGRQYDPSFSGGKDPLPDHLKPFGGKRPLSLFDDVEFYSWVVV